MSNDIKISRELAERLCKRPGKECLAVNHADILDRGAAQAELRALLAAPVVERQEPEAVPVAWMRFDDDQRAIFTRSKRGNKSEPLYAHPTAYRHTSPPAPVAVVLPARRDTPEYWNPYQNPSAERACGWNGYDDELKRLNPGLFAKVKD